MCVTTVILLLIPEVCGLISSLADGQVRGGKDGETRLNSLFGPFYLGTETQD